MPLPNILLFIVCTLLIVISVINVVYKNTISDRGHRFIEKITGFLVLVDVILIIIIVLNK